VIHRFPQPAHEVTTPPALLVDAARCWRDARDAGRPPQPSLSDMLAAHDCAMLAPVLDSLCLFYEAALGRRLTVGAAFALSEDEQLLLGLVDGSEPRCCLECSEGTASAFDCALCSTRIMLALNLGQPSFVTMQ
jgi:hypothetical protein